jgi:hypothetical protein
MESLDFLLRDLGHAEPGQLAALETHFRGRNNPNAKGDWRSAEWRTKLHRRPPAKRGQG